MKEFVDFLKLPPTILGALTVASGLLLFLPKKVLEKLYMESFKEKCGFVIGIVFIVSASILVVMLAVNVYKSVKKKTNLKKLKKSQSKFLKKITGNKVEVIKGLLQEPTHTAMLPMQDGLVIELQHYNVITPAGQTQFVSMPDPEIYFFLQPWVEERILEDEELKKKYL